MGALSVQGEEGKIRQRMVDADVVDCIVALPANLFFRTTIPVALWFVSKSRGGDGHRDRRGEVLFIDARGLGRMVSRNQRALTEEDVARVADVYRSWKAKAPAVSY